MTDIDRYAWQALNRHFKTDDLTGLASSRRKFAAHMLPDLQTVIEEQITTLSPKLIGVHQWDEFEAMKLSDMVIRDGEAVALTPLQYQDIDIGEDVPYASLHNGLWLFLIGQEPVAILLSQFFDHWGGRTLQVEIAYLPGEQASAFSRGFLSKIQAAGESSRYYRNKVLSFEFDARNSGMPGTIRVHRLPAVPRNDVVLSEATMARLDANVFDFDRHREGLKRLGQSTQKGILLYGPPGTGKTHVIRYVSANLPGRTTVLVTAEQTTDIAFYIALARTLQPSIVVLEDVDLVGRSRENIYSSKAECLLNRLLNEIDGLEPNADILFLLTTNRPEDIEDALASRPGRVDEAIEIPLPDAGCRERLIALYGRALVFEDGALADAVARSENSSAAYVKEMVRRLAQRSLARDGGDVVSREDVEMVFGEIRALSSGLNSRLLGLSEKASRRQNPEEDECDCCD